MSATQASGSRRLVRLIALLSDLRLAIVLLLLIALASGIGTAIPQREPQELYHRLYDAQPWLGLLRADAVLGLQLDHVYSSGWFLALLAWLGLALLLCSWRRQWPALQASLRWIDYRSPRQLSKLAVAETVVCPAPEQALDRLAETLRAAGWQLQRHPERLAARRGVAGRVGPLLVHAGLVVLMVGAAWGALAGQRLEQFLAPGRELELLTSRGRPQLTIALDDFVIERDPAGRPEQFRSQLRLIPPVPVSSAAGAGAGARGLPAASADAAAVAPAGVDAVDATSPRALVPSSAQAADPDSAAQASVAAASQAAPADPFDAGAAGPAASGRPGSSASSASAADSSVTAPSAGNVLRAEISVNHPLRHRGLTLYQADWSLVAVNLRLGRSPVLQLPLQSFPQLGEQVWGLVLPTRPDGSEPVFLALSSEQGPADVYGPDGALLGRLSPGGEALEVRGLPLRLVSVLPASGILLKRDPGVPLVYAGFAVALLGGGLSLVATRQLWAVAEVAEAAGVGQASPPAADPPAAFSTTPDSGRAMAAPIRDPAAGAAAGGAELPLASAGAGRLHVAGLCNRNLPAFAAELPRLLAEAGVGEGASEAA